MEVEESGVPIHAINAKDPASKNLHSEFIYKEYLPPAEHEEPAAVPEVQQAPAPVVDAKPMTIEKKGTQ